MWRVQASGTTVRAVGYPTLHDAIEGLLRLRKEYPELDWRVVHDSKANS